MIAVVSNPFFVQLLIKSLTGIVLNFKKNLDGPIRGDLIAGCRRWCKGEEGKKWTALSVKVEALVNAVKRIVQKAEKVRDNIRSV